MKFNGEFYMTDKGDNIQELTLFDITEEVESTKKINVVEATFKEVIPMNWNDLFKGYA